MSSAQLDAMMELSQARAKAYLNIAKSMVINEFGPATEHTHTEVAIRLAAAMMQHEGAQIIADSVRVAES